MGEITIHRENLEQIMDHENTLCIPPCNNKKIDPSLQYKMDQYVITVFRFIFCSKGPKSYFLCLNIMLVYYIRNDVTVTSKSK